MSCEYCKDGCELGYFHIHKSPFGYEICGYDKEGCDTSEDINYCPHCGCSLNSHPLTLDELKEMEGEPVWIVELENNDSYYAIIGKIDHQSIALYDIHCNRYGLDSGALKLYGKTWIAYRQKVEE